MSSTTTTPSFAPGDTILYPHHGAGLVLSETPRIVMGEERAYLRILILHNGMVLHVPVDCTEQVGMQRIPLAEALGRATVDTVRLPAADPSLRPALEALRTQNAQMSRLLDVLVA